MVYVGNLHEPDDRGLACRCVCRDCKRELAAHLGAKQSWHFQHKASDLACNPQPMSLLHAYVRDSLARRKTITLPDLKEDHHVLELGRQWPVPVRIPATTVDVESGRAEVWSDGIQPDVVYKLATGETIAIEVKLTHAVDEEKVTKLKKQFSKSLELDVSDLPATGIGADELDAVLADSRRWTWLHSHWVTTILSRARGDITWANKAWRPSSNPLPEPSPQPPASKKLDLVARRIVWAKAALGQRSAQEHSAESNQAWLGSLAKEDRAAISCVQLGLDPKRLPAYFTQRLEGRCSGPFEHHGYSWQPVVFMKWGLHREPFTATEVAEWAALAMPDRIGSLGGPVSLNGFSRPAAVLHLLLRNWAAQGLLVAQGGPRPESITFRAAFARKADLTAHLNPGQTARGTARDSTSYPLGNATT
ncbi:hypothetical protein KIH07_01655 [Hydrogenophaga taeniospiralis]|uniref:hypothetical protein n=1 Tax=Hydrogenophaga taeniospiralis TaxID=65656 RepID=UPI001CFC15A3|nr:hypothetical protein [Hydrogenophaga taeniospiralis]MCB4362418.1 hypothetical protein [Hydrogenophaga taeniospiralis]